MPNIKQPTKIEEMQERQKLRNDKSKYWAAVIGQNMSMAVCLMIPVFLITLIWTDTTLPKLGASLAMDTLITAVLFVAGEFAALSVGIPSGKLDDDYLAMEDAFRKRVVEIKARGILKMGIFCEWQIAAELVGAKKAYCRKYKIDYKKYKSEMAHLSEDELIRKYGKDKGKRIHEINCLDPIELTPELILGEQCNGLRGGISISGEDYVDKHRRSKWNLVWSVLSVVFTVGVGFAFSPGVTWGRIAFTIYQLIAVLLRMNKGFNKGVRAYNKIQVEHRESQIYYMDKYEEFLNTPGLYEAAAAKYGDGEIVPEKNMTACREFIACPDA